MLYLPWDMEGQGLLRLSVLVAVILSSVRKSIQQLVCMCTLSPQSLSLLGFLLL